MPRHHDLSHLLIDSRLITAPKRRASDYERVWRIALALALLGVMGFSAGVWSGWWV